MCLYFSFNGNQALFMNQNNISEIAQKIGFFRPNINLNAQCPNIYKH